MAVAGRAALASGGNMKGSHHFSGYVPERNLIHTYGPLGSSLAEEGFKLGPFGTGRANGLPVNISARFLLPAVRSSVLLFLHSVSSLFC
jgi:hypothetical protein